MRRWRLDHPQQSFWCALRSFLFGPKVQSGRSWTECGDDHWWACNHCGETDSSL